MIKNVAICATVLILMTASASSAQIIAGQNFGIGGTNNVALLGGPGAVDSTEISTVGQLQQGSTAGGMVRNIASNNGGFVLGAGVGGIGVGGVSQEACLGAGQLQLHPGWPTSLGANLQGGNIGLNQNLGQIGQGALVGFGIATAFLNQFEIIATPFGTNVNAAPTTATAFNAL